jgi:N6-L-threonylcarbamoyladenine synthase/protein kinase Bud32
MDLADCLTEHRVNTTIKYLSLLHSNGMVHGDPTTRNIRIDTESNHVYLIDFGLGFYTDDIEDYAMDLHVFEASLRGMSSNYKFLWASAKKTYELCGDLRVTKRLSEIELRGRYH